MGGLLWPAGGCRTWFAAFLVPTIAGERLELARVAFLRRGTTAGLLCATAVILPAVLRIRLPYHRVLYLPLALLHMALAVRVLGDLTGAGSVRATGGVLTVAALLVFAGCAAGRTGRPSRPGAARGRPPFAERPRRREESAGLLGPDGRH
ncbi:hypothetical protein AB0J63_29485 [Streptosporangium canum]|uniref:hypothetical protein n=1 Tax=Streptosporangium canum TaxID=324952 RepID=UPI003421C0F0